jgi:type IV secretory pathway VirB10-like protein
MTWPGRRLAAALLVTAFLAGCADKAPPPPPAPPAETVIETPTTPAAKIPVPRKKPAPPSLPTNATIEPPEALHPEPVSPPPDVAPPPPIKLDGLEAAAVEKQLGPPQVQADSPPAVVWRYAAGDCAVDVYLYKDLQSGALRALFVDVKGDDRSDQRREACLQRLAERHAADAPPPG